MTQNAKQRKHSNENDRPAKVITAPDGTKIQITAGRKLQVIRSFASDPKITDAQFRALVCIIDRLNEGKEGTDESRWGSAYPNYDTMAKDIAKDERAARRIVKELEDGQRQTRSGGVTKFVPCKPVLNVQRSKDEDERDSVNEYRLNEWGAFAVDAREGAVTCEEGGGHLSDRGWSPVKEEAVTAPDSSHLLTSETQLTNTPPLAPACGEHRLVGCSIVEGDAQRQGAANDNADDGNERQPVDDDSRSEERPVLVDEPESFGSGYTPTFEAFWNLCPRKSEKDKPEAFREWKEIGRAGGVTPDQIIRGMRMYQKSCQGREPRYVKGVVRWLKERGWTEFAGMPSGSRRSTAI